MFMLLEIGGQGPSMNDVFEYFEHQRTSVGGNGGRGAVAPKSGGSQARNMTGPDDIAVLWIELEDIEPLIWRGQAARTTMNLKGIV